MRTRTPFVPFLSLATVNELLPYGRQKSIGHCHRRLVFFRNSRLIGSHLFLFSQLLLFGEQFCYSCSIPAIGKSLLLIHIAHEPATGLKSQGLNKFNCTRSCFRSYRTSDRCRFLPWSSSRIRGRGRLRNLSVLLHGRVQLAGLSCR